MATRISGDPYKGKIVLYVHMQDDPREGQVPNVSAALIVKVYEDGSCNLKVFTPSGGELYQFKKTYNQSSLRGCWTNLPAQS